MKKFALVTGAVLFSSGLVVVGLYCGGCLDEGGSPSTSQGPLLRWHHTGRAELAQSTNAGTLRQIDALPITDSLRGQLSTNLARSARKIWEKELPAAAADSTALLQPLLYDLLSAEAYLEIRGPVGRTETALAIELNSARAELWSTNLWQLARLWKLGEPRGIATDGFDGWEWKRSTAPNLFQFHRAGKWLVLGLGQDKLTLAPAWLARSKQSQRPIAALNDLLLEIEADLPGLRPWIPLLADFPLPPAHLTVAGRGDNVRTEIRFQYPGKVRWAYEPWKIPTNLVSEPLSSFTVARGVAPWLERVKGLKQLGLKPMPNQFCGWGITNDLCRIYFAVPVADATNALRQLAPTVPLFAYDRFDHPLGKFLYLSNRAELDWRGLPYIQPLLKAAPGPDSEYIVGAMFFLSPRTYPPPPELYSQIANRTNLLYYDWELTDHRVEHGKQLYDLANIVSDRIPAAPQGTVSRKWIAAAGPRLRDSVTEITQTGPQELTLVRKSSIGLTGIELATFSTWLDSPNFPFKIDPGPRSAIGNTNPVVRSNTPPTRPGVGPAPKTGAAPPK